MPAPPPPLPCAACAHPLPTTDPTAPCPSCGLPAAHSLAWFHTPTDGLRCATCRYDLSGLPPTALCPECATPVHASRPALALSVSRDAWRAAGSAITAFGFQAIAAVLGVFVANVASQHGAGPLVLAASVLPWTLAALWAAVAIDRLDAALASRPASRGRLPSGLLTHAGLAFVAATTAALVAVVNEHSRAACVLLGWAGCSAWAIRNWLIAATIDRVLGRAARGPRLAARTTAAAATLAAASLGVGIYPLALPMRTVFLPCIVVGLLAAAVWVVAWSAALSAVINRWEEHNTL